MSFWKIFPCPPARDGRFVTVERNLVGHGLTLVQINPNLAVELRGDHPRFGWLFYQHPDGQYVSLRKLSGFEIEQAYDQAADLRVLDAGARRGTNRFELSDPDRPLHRPGP